MPSDDDIPYVNRSRLRWKNSSESLLGQGSFGMVYRGTWNGSPVAIKVVKPVRRDSNTNEEYRAAESAAMKQHRREIHRFKVVQNPYIIQFFEVFRDTNPRDLYIVTELLEGGSLHDSLMQMRARKAVLKADSFLLLAQHMAFGLNHVHSKSYTHGDMKPQNVLLTAAFQFEDRGDENVLAFVAPSAKAKIADFGLSKRLDGAEQVALLNSSAATTDFGNGPCGTYLYMSPEAFEGVSGLKDAVAKAADVYAYGLVLFELLSGLQSWGLEQVKNPMSLAIMVRGGKRPSWGESKDSINPKYVKLVEQCWSNKPEDRPTMDDIVCTLAELQEEYEETARKEKEASPSPQAISLSNVTGTQSSSSWRSSQKTSSQKSSQKSQKASSQVLRRKIRPNYDAFSPMPPKDDDSFGDYDDLKDGGKADDDALSDAGSQSTIRHVDSLPFLTETGGTDGSELVGSSIEHKVGADKFPNRYLGPAPDSGSEYDDDETPPKEAEEDIVAGDSSDSDDVDNDDDEEGAVVEPEPQQTTANGIPEIDQSFVGGVLVHRVQSIALQPPSVEPLQMNYDGEERPTLGMGSVAGNQDQSAGLLGRADADLLNSFLDAPLLGQGGDVGNTHGQPAPQGFYEQPNPVGPVTPANDFTHTPPLVTPDHHVSGVFAEPEGRFAVGQEYPQHQLNLAKPEQHVQSPLGYPIPENGQYVPHSRVFPSRSYSSPDVDDDTLSEFLENDNMSLSECHPLLTASKPASPSTAESQRPSMPGGMPVPQQTPYQLSPLMGSGNPYNRSFLQNGVATSHQAHGEASYRPANMAPFGRMPGSSAPPISNGGIYGRPSGHAQQDSMGRIPNRVPPSWQSPEPEYPNAETLNPPYMNLSGSPAPGMIDVNSVNLALKSPDAMMTLRSLWTRGNKQIVASGLASARDLSGTEMLQQACEFLKESSQMPADRQDPIITKDLCTAIGNIARNESAHIGPDAVLMALRVTASTMFIYHQAMQHNAPWSVQVYASCNFALCNLFKVCNVIHDPKLRTDLATWIVHSISWNVHQDGSNHGPHLEALAYTATSAARNFMWMNADNVAAFVSRSSQGRNIATARLISSMKYFDYTSQSVAVLEASLSALAMIVHFPQQRVEFMERHGGVALLEVLQRYVHYPKIIALVLAMVTVLLSGPTKNEVEVEALEKGFSAARGCEVVVSTLDQVRSHMQGQGDTERLDALEKGYGALLTIARFCDPLRVAIAQKAMTNISILVKWLSSSSSPSPGQPGHMGGMDNATANARLRLGVTLCELIQELGKEQMAVTYLREHCVAGPLEYMLHMHGGNDGFASSCRAALATLS